ncbi:hypothetical protein LAZ67_5004434 [Cordylochernes scorpioides]|uniref:Histone-lysine N-methyltransferase SETMAR n=1 Tax=Cordylochernes scorpioides TaxID=51811 RepID=A0ABY6KI21_9ARAC|nr:hypothetical protein LAZ67_5004434 [Cordylochernes scorpioides]
MGWTLMPHPAYNPDLAPSDFYLFGKLKDSLRVRTFENDEMLLHEVRGRFRKQDTAFYQSAFVSWKERWTKCVQREGERFLQRPHASCPILFLIIQYRLNTEHYTWKIRKDKLQDDTAIYLRQEQTINDKKDDFPIDDTTTKPLFTPQEKGHKGTRDKVPRLRGNPWHVRSMSITTIIASCGSQLP